MVVRTTARSRTATLALGVVVALVHVQAPATAATSEPKPGDVPAGYYEDAEGKAGDELKDALHEIISEQTVLSYDDVWDAVSVTDEDPENADNVTLFYSGDSRSKDRN